MVREANRGAVIPTAGGERGLGQGRVCGGLIWSPFAPRPMPDPFQELGLCAFAHLHSPQVINRNLSKNDWNNQGTKILDPAAGRRLAARVGRTFCDL